MRGQRQPLVTVECSRPGDAYTIFESGPSLVLHLAGPSATGGTGPCICGFDRMTVGFSVGGGTSGPGVAHEVCEACWQLAGDAPIRGTNATKFNPRAVDHHLEERINRVARLRSLLFGGVMQNPELTFLLPLEER